MMVFWWWSFGLDKKYKYPFLNEAYVLCNLQKMHHSFSLQTFTSDTRMRFWNDTARKTNIWISPFLCWVFAFVQNFSDFWLGPSREKSENMWEVISSLFWDLNTWRLLTVLSLFFEPFSVVGIWANLKPCHLLHTWLLNIKFYWRPWEHWQEPR